MRVQILRQLSAGWFPFSLANPANAGLVVNLVDLGWQSGCDDGHRQPDFGHARSRGCLGGCVQRYNNPHLNVLNTLMYPSINAGERRLPGVADILANAQCNHLQPGPVW